MDRSMRRISDNCFKLFWCNMLYVDATQLGSELWTKRICALTRNRKFLRTIFCLARTFAVERRCRDPKLPWNLLLLLPAASTRMPPSKLQTTKPLPVNCGSSPLPLRLLLSVRLLSPLSACRRLGCMHVCVCVVCAQACAYIHAKLPTT
jgi:hypothetical protein